MEKRTTIDPNDLQAPSYNELYKTMHELRERVRTLETATPTLTASTENNNEIRSRDNTTDYRLLPDLDRSIPPFDGLLADHLAEDWLNSIDGLATINNWPFRYRLQFVRSNLVSAARNWFLAEDFADWSDFTNKFRDAFVPHVSISDRWDIMRSREQNENEHVVDYFYDKIRLCKALSLPFREIRDHVIQGIRSHQLSVYVLGRSHDNQSQLLNDLREWERLISLRATRFGNPTNAKPHRQGNRQPIVPIRDPAPTKANIISRPPVQSAVSISAPTNITPRAEVTRVPVKCYNCDRLGHISRDCNRPRRPIKCSGYGSNQHTRRYCTETEPKRITGEALRADIGNEQLANNPFVKRVNINGTTVTGLIDTGCSDVLVRATVAARCGVITRATTLPLYTVGSGNTPGATIIGEATADASIEGVIAAEHNIKVVSDSTIPVDILVGRTWLEVPHVNYYKCAGELIIESNSVIEPDFLQEDKTNEDSEAYTTMEVTELENRTAPITATDTTVGPQATEIQIKELVRVINQYRDVFAMSIRELGCTGKMKMDIIESNDSQPVCVRPYKTSPKDRLTISNILREWKLAGIISDSESPYASPVLLVNKVSGEKRLCVDYRRLNQQTVAQAFPMPDIDSQLSSLAHGCIFTTLDLSNGFLQIPLTEEAKNKTAFVTEDTTARFERMPFGLKGAPATFQKLMSVVFKELRESGKVSTYLDDIILPSRDWNHMLSDLRLVFDALRAAKLTLKPAKCTFGATQLEYLGFRISQGVIRPGKKIEAIINYPSPIDAHGVRRFLGLAGYFRRFIPNYAAMTAQLTELTGNDVPFAWTTERQTIFEKLKVLLVSEPVVHMYDPKARVTQVHTDASAIALSGMLLQGPTTTDLHMVYAVSKKTTQAESMYHSSRLELYAIIWTLTRLRPYLLGIQFTVVTDCQALTYLNVHKSVKPQVARWFETLQEFEFDIKYRPGTKMAHVDALSRVVYSESGPEESVETEVSKRMEVFVALSVGDRVRFMQQADIQTKNLIQLLQTPELCTRQEMGTMVDYELEGGLLYRRYQGKLLLVVPKCMRKGIVIGAHDYGGHFSVDRTITQITRDYWFTGMKRYVRQHINMCLDCLVHKKPGGRKPGLLHPIPPGRRPFQVVHVDHLGPFETSVTKNRYLLVVADNLTKYIHLYPCKTTDAAGVVRRMDKLCNERGIPERVITDRGYCFTSRVFKEFCQSRGIQHILNSTRHPQANGQVERANRTILPLLSISTENQQRWDAKIKDIERMLNTAVNKTTSRTPYEVLHGYQPRFHGGLLQTLSRTKDEWTEPGVEQQQTHDRIVQEQENMKRQYDKKHYIGVKFDCGKVVVMLKQPTPSEPSKLQSKYRERPLQVLQVLPGDTYRVAEVNAEGNQTFATTAHVSQLKSWKILREPDEDEDEGEGEDDDDGATAIDLPTRGAEHRNTQTGSRPKRDKKTPAYLSDFVTS